MRKLAIPAAALLLFAVVAGGCSAKTKERGQDSPVGQRNDAPADVINYPDGFGNVAHKCDGKGHRVYVLYHGDGGYGSVTVIPDETCK